MAKYRKKDRKAIKDNTKPRVKAFTPVAPLTDNQRKAVVAMRHFTITLLIGMAGTGKSLLAVSEALYALDRGLVTNIVLIRPMVAVGESLGYLPGNVFEKVSPYSTPLLLYIDELMQSKGYAQRLIEAGVIELAPLALIRGRTFENTFVILDEAQNITPEQMKAALTRLGQGSRMVIIGDEDQTDLKKSVTSGLTDLLDRVEESDYTSIVEMELNDIQRSEIIKEVYRWYNE